jgi:succinate dehydrogenase/fumarate reductase flavoprotein subunit
LIRKHEVVIIGAGISGLTAAFQASQSCDVAVVSKVPAMRSARSHGSTTSYTYDSMNRLTGATDTGFDWDGNGNMVYMDDGVYK